MRKFFFTVILSLLLASGLSAQLSRGAFAAKGIYQTQFELDPLNFRYGTAFCAPGKLNILITAAHAVEFGVWVNDATGGGHEVKVLSKDEKKDIAVLQSVEPLCQFAPFQWAPKNAEVGDPVWLYGWGGVRAKAILTVGVISSEPGVSEANTVLQAAQLNALLGHSGGPVFDAQNRIIGMLVGGFSAGDEMDVIVPVEVLKKVIK